MNELFNGISPEDRESALQNEVAQRTGVIEWEDPQALPNTLPAVEAFDNDFLPTVFRAYVDDVSQQAQCPADFIAASLITAVSSIVGRSIAIRPKVYDDWTVIPNLWGVCVGRPGIMKSQAISKSLCFIGELESKSKSEFELESKKANALAMVAKEKEKGTAANIREALKNDNEESARALALQSIEDEDDPPTRKRYKTNDATIEKLGELLQGNPRGILVVRDELIGWLRGLDREGREESRAFYLESWNGDGSFTFDRIGRGTIDIPSTTVSIIGGIQPGPLSEYLSRVHRGKGGDDGLLQRFQLLVWPDVDETWINVDRKPDNKAKIAVRDVFNRLDNIDPNTIGAEYDRAYDDNGDREGIPFLRFDPDAQAILDQWRGELEKKIRCGNETPAMEAHFSKYRSLVPSLALLFHLIDNPAGGPVGRDALLRALAYCQYLGTHARRAYAQNIDPAMAAAVHLDKRIVSGALGDKFKARDVYRKGWSGLDKDTTWDALRILEDFDRVARSKNTPHNGGRPSITWHVNPALLTE